MSYFFEVTFFCTPMYSFYLTSLTRFKYADNTQWNQCEWKKISRSIADLLSKIQLEVMKTELNTFTKYKIETEVNLN